MRLVFREFTDRNTTLANRLNLMQISRHVEEYDFAMIWMSDGEFITVSQIDWADLKSVIEKVQRPAARGLELA